MDNDYTVTAAYVTAIAAIVAPTITALIHSIKEYCLVKVSHTIEHRLEMFETFSKSYANCQYGSEKVGYMETFYTDTLKLIALCHCCSTRRNLFRLAHKVKTSGASKRTDRLYERCIFLLSREL